MDEEDQFLPEPLEGFEIPEALQEDPRFILVLRILRHTQEGLHRAIELLEHGDTSAGRQALAMLSSDRSATEEAVHALQVDQIIEGVFNGEEMIGGDGESYFVPPNYASKSRLVEGDLLKLSLRQDGSLVYKQISPVDRRRVNARLAWDASASAWVGIAEEGDALWKLLSASVSFFKGQEGDRLVLLVPKTSPSAWGAVEHIVKKGG